MRTTSGMILGAVLLTIAVGCGSKPGPTSPAEVPISADPAPTPAPPAKVVHELDPAKHVIPERPVAGPVGGVEITPTVVVEGEYLVFRTHKPGSNETEREVMMKIRAGTDKPLPTGKLVVSKDMQAGDKVPEVLVGVPGKQTMGYPDSYAMTLVLDPRKDGKLPGRIYLCLPDDEKSFLAGTFMATAPRQPIEPPELDDVPLINGSVAVTGAGSKAVLVTGYGAAPNGDVSKVGIGFATIEIGESTAAGRWVSINDDKPRVTSLFAGDGKSLPNKYEHTKLTPGRYLTFAQLKDGPAVWKWVNVGPQSTVKADLMLDATKVGGLEVTAPLGSLQKIQLAPANEPGQPHLDPILFELMALQLGLEQNIVQRKALFKNLAPGRYEVRDKASGQIRVVEIAAGKTAELDFDAKPAPAKKPDPAPEPKQKG